MEIAGVSPKLFQRGNHKIGKDTLIFNMGPALTCPSRRLGLCQLAEPHKCYARKAERQYPSVLPYRERQAHAWRTKNAWQWSEAIKGVVERSRTPIQHIRFNEAGDFYSQACVEKLKAIAAKVPELKFYGHTARRDLSFRNLPPNLCIHGSGWSRKNIKPSLVTTSPKPNLHICPGNCRTCDICKSTETAIPVQFIIH